MKKIFSLLASLLVAGVVFSQAQSIVTINTTGNRNKQLLVDNRSYTITNTTASQEQTITINDLAAGQHSLEVIRNNQNNNRVSTKTYFTVREGYDLTISINANGAVSTSEVRRDGVNAGRPVSTVVFNRLLSQTKAKASSTARSNFLEKEMTNNNRMYSSAQMKQLIELVNSESMRLKLAKQSYPKITDRQNFYLVSNLLNSAANRTALSDHIASLGLDDDDYAASDMGAPITAERFTTIYNEVYAESSSYERDYYLRNFFAKEYNFYTSTQAAQLIRLVPGEEERFNLAKAAYRGVVDRQNYNLVNQLLSNASNRAALTAYINSYDNNSNVRTAMSTTDFDRLYSSVYNQSSSTRYSSLYNAFTSRGNYFTVAQAKKIIPLVSSESSRLALAKAVYPSLVDRSNYAQFNEFLAYSSSESELYNYVISFNNSQGGYGMSETEFNKIYQDAGNSWNQATRVSLIGDAFSYSNYFSVDQVRQLLLLVGSESERLSLARNAYDNIVDKANISRLYDLFTYTAYRSELESFVASNGAVTGTTPVAMPESEFNSIYSDVQWTFGFGAKMNALTDIFNKSTNYFTVQQARKLILLVSAESNRLELAKLSYDNITDRGNFSQLYDVFSSQSSKDELANFVNNRL